MDYSDDSCESTPYRLRKLIPLTYDVLTLGVEGFTPGQISRMKEQVATFRKL